MTEDELRATPVEKPPEWLSLPDDDLIQRLALMSAYVDQELADLAPAIWERNSIRAEILRRCEGKGLPHPRFIVRVERSKHLQKNDEAFLALRDIPGLDPEEVAACVRSENVEVLKTDASRLKSLAKRYGGPIGSRIAQVMEKALVYVEGPERLIFRPKDEE